MSVSVASSPLSRCLPVPSDVHDPSTASHAAHNRFHLRARACRSAGRPPPLRGATSETVADILRDCAENGLTDELRVALEMGAADEPGDALRVVRDLVYELAGARNRDLAVDVLIYATGIAEFDLTSLRDYALKHGLTPEGFRQHVLKLQRRLGLPRRARQTSDAN